MTISQDSLRPGITRVRDPFGFVGTVLYVGPVSSAKSPTEIYAGIAWDDDTRGKHDGSVICRTTNQIVRHFKCGPTQGSFLRLSKVDVGAALTPKLMRSRYVKPNAELVAPDNLLPHVAKTAGGRDKPIEFWGEIKIRNRQQLEVVEKISLRMLGIARPCSGVEEDEMEEFSHLKGIDLAGNLLSDWDDAMAILRQFPNLQSVSLASNRINDLSISYPGDFSNIRSLNLNHCNLSSFKSIERIGVSMPNLEELCVAHCNLSDMAEDSVDSTSKNCNENDYSTQLEQVFGNLVLFDLSNCNLTSWENQISVLRKLTKLESLILNENKFESISILIPKVDDEKCDKSYKSVTFPSLASLQLAGTSIKSWASIDNLNGVPSLKSLRLRNTPLTNPLGIGEVRSTAIARLPSLEYFNASPISERERIEAERRYVSSVARELLLASPETSLGGSSDSKQNTAVDENSEQSKLLEHNPRFQSLMEKHKDSMISLRSSSGFGGGTESNGGKIGEDIINVTIRSMAAGSCDIEPLIKRLPRSLQVRRVKAMCSRAFGLEIDLQILHFRMEGDPFPTELDDAEHTLAYFGVNDGAEILVNEVDEEAMEKENARRLVEHDRRILEQEQHVTMLQSAQRNDRPISIVGSENSHS